ncbi:MAG: 3-oxoacyl-[acyl-carrier-protein] reductase [Elusimicrobia bacterium]|nr:3-oxoacyl-[acyl-carrier-protein] reductase [Elusimicrobiota bacterium]
MTVDEKTLSAETSAKRLKDKVAVVTGSALGIGRATAALFAREGAKVVVVDLNQAACDEAAAQIAKDTGADTLGVAANVSDLASCEAVAKSVIDRFGKIDILVNNAGITKDNLLLRLTEADWDAVMNVNLKGVFFFTKAVIRAMFKAHAGVIVNIASVVGQEGNIGQTNYAASKGGVIAFTKACAKEFASRNIRVNALAPGFVRTRLTDAISEEAKTRMAERILLGRMGEPEEVAKAVLFLASDDASYITGQVLGVNGGMYI